MSQGIQRRNDQIATTGGLVSSDEWHAAAWAAWAAEAEAARAAARAAWDRMSTAVLDAIEIEIRQAQ